ncbi:MAG: hypothetical protein H0W64_10975 [Gammaproteobacteria bacterium]|nr:hypothetical protein [Gammaproteobacteria bacterium]
MADTDLDAEKHAIDNADIVIVGNSTTKSLSPLTNFKRLGFNKIPYKPQNISASSSMLIGDSKDSSNSFLVREKSNYSDAYFAYQALQYAKKQGKKTIFISLLAPYDLPNYKDVSDVMLAGYNFYGYLTDGNHGYYRGPSMQALTRIIFGISRAKAKLPINIPNPTEPTEIINPRGYGLTDDF